MNVKVDVTLKSDTKEYEQLLKRLSAAKDAWVDVGYFQAKYTPVKKKSTGDKPDLSPATPAQKAATNEFGDPEKGIPSRPFMRNTMRKNNYFKDFMEAKMKIFIKKGKSINDLMPLLGEKGRKEMIAEINKGTFAPNAASTVARKKSSKPLIDSSEMRNNTTYRINHK